MKTKIKQILSSEYTKGVISIAAAIVMYYTPDHIDHVIEALLTALGISKLTIEKNK